MTAITLDSTAEDIIGGGLQRAIGVVPGVQQLLWFSR